MSLDQYLQRFTGHRRITIVGPTLAQPLCAGDVDEPVIWVDGGANHRPPEHDNKSDGDMGNVGFAVGDGDSFRGKLDQYLDPDKDYSDLAYVLRRLPGHFAEVILLGFLGHRRDHEWFNLGEVHHFLAAAARLKSPAMVRFDRCLNGYSCGEWRFGLHGIFSLAVLAPTTVQLSGACRFPIPSPRQIPPLTSLGLSNRGFGEICLRAGGPVFIFQPPYNDAPE